MIASKEKHVKIKGFHCFKCGSPIQVVFETTKRFKKNAPYYFCKKCDLKYKRPFRLCVSERKMRHKELFEMFKIIMLGFFGILGSIVVANINQAVVIDWIILLYIGLYGFLIIVLVFDHMLEEVRREIEILEEVGQYVGIRRE